MQKWEQEGVGTVELDLKKLNQDIATLRKNRENVPLELLKTKYKKPYAKLKEEIRAQFEIYMKHIIVLGILKTGPDLTGAKAESMVNQIQKIIDEEKAAGHQKEVTHAVFEEFNLAKAENLACGYYTDRVKYEAYAPYWLEHIHQEPDGKVTSDLLPGMTWHPEAGVWVSFSEPSFTLMMPPTQAEIDAQHKEDTERFKKIFERGEAGMSYQGNNPEGYPDPTANQAVGIVSREEKEAAKAKKRATREYDIRAAMKAIRAIAGAYGLTIENRITFKDKETEEIFR